MQPSVAVIGSGPAGLIVADRLSQAGVAVLLYEKRPSLGRKLLIAGATGLNITNDLPLTEFTSALSPNMALPLWQEVLEDFPPQDWIKKIESLGIETFLGSGGRYFVAGMKAAPLLKAWRDRLEQQGVSIVPNKECEGFRADSTSVALSFSDNSTVTVDKVCFALGGASWEPVDTLPRWPKMFESHGIHLEPFESSNAGFEVAWTDAFLKEAEGLPLKNICLHTPRGKKLGELVITRYGLEGTPIYTVGQTGPVTLDLLPDLDDLKIQKHLAESQENLLPMRRIKKQLGLGPGALALVFHHSPSGLLESKNLAEIAKTLKQFPMELGKVRPLSEAISSKGGIPFDELDAHLMLKRCPGVYCVGEMVAWDAPTGGYLIQACVSQGNWAARAILKALGILPQSLCQ